MADNDKIQNSPKPVVEPTIKSYTRPPQEVDPPPKPPPPPPPPPPKPSEPNKSGRQ